MIATGLDIESMGWTSRWPSSHRDRPILLQHVTKEDSKLEMRFNRGEPSNQKRKRCMVSLDAMPPPILREQADLSRCWTPATFTLLTMEKALMARSCNMSSINLVTPCRQAHV
jgi:hypothetical protein